MIEEIDKDKIGYKCEEELLKIHRWRKRKHDNLITPYISPRKMNHVILSVG